MNWFLVHPLRIWKDAEAAAGRDRAMLWRMNSTAWTAGITWTSYQRARRALAAHLHRIPDGKWYIDDLHALSACCKTESRAAIFFLRKSDF